MDPLAVVTDFLRTLWTTPEHLNSGQAFIAVMASVVIISGVFNVLTMLADIGETIIETVTEAIAQVFMLAFSPKASEERRAAYLAWCERNGEIPFRIAGGASEYARWLDETSGDCWLDETSGDCCPLCKMADDLNVDVDNHKRNHKGSE